MTANALRARLDASMTEVDWQRQVTEYARLRGWRWCHFRASRRADGSWRTAVAGDGAGWPDCVFVKDRVVLAELKSESGKLSPVQREWVDALEHAQAEVYVWRPSDWPEVERVLS